MFGRRFFGGRFYGAAYWGDGGDLPPDIPLGQQAGVCMALRARIEPAVALSAVTGVTITTSTPNCGD